MPHLTVRFVYHTGLSRTLFRNARLAGSWNSHGRFSNQWSETPMIGFRDETAAVGNGGAEIAVHNGLINVILPALRVRGLAEMS